MFPSIPSPSQDHPRVCGEQSLSDSDWIRILGSPPRVRGTEGRQGVGGYGLRITPACAGNSVREAFAPAAKKDHPRVCGEQVPWASGKYGPKGSPPRVRGTVRGVCRRGMSGRITPACAGNSSPRFPAPPGPRDHPRVCGEQGMSIVGTVPCEGSPPRVRGTGAATRRRCPRAGITPACAGNSAFKMKI